MPNRSGRYCGTELQRVEAQHRTAVGRLVMLHRWMSADDRRWLLEKFPELEVTLTHLDRVDNRISDRRVDTFSSRLSDQQTLLGGLPTFFTQWWSGAQNYI
jgi:hypothetical protein